jgi:hypothetical protein
MECELDIKTQLLLTAHEAQEWDKVVDHRFRHIFQTNEAKSYPRKISIRVRSVGAGGVARTSGQIRELFLQSHAILRVPIEFLRCNDLGGGINHFWEKAMVSWQRIKPSVVGRAP